MLVESYLNYEKSDKSKRRLIGNDINREVLDEKCKLAYFLGFGDCSRGLEVYRETNFSLTNIESRNRKLFQFSDIDRGILNENGEFVYFLEIKERSNSLNAYRETKFPVNKIESAKKLIKETKLPVYVILKFADCWSRLTVDLEKDYKKDDEPFAPKYRIYQKESLFQIPAIIPVEELEVLNWRDLCRDKFMLKNNKYGAK